MLTAIGTQTLVCSCQGYTRLVDGDPFQQRALPSSHFRIYQQATPLCCGFNGTERILPASRTAMSLALPTDQRKPEGGE